MPQQPDKFWASQENKWNSQMSIRDIACNGDYVNVSIIASYVVSYDEVLPAKVNGGA